MFSGQLRSLERTHKNLIDFLEKSFGSYQTFAHVPHDENSNNFSEYFKRQLLLLKKIPKLEKLS